MNMYKETDSNSGRLPWTEGLGTTHYSIFISSIDLGIIISLTVAMTHTCVPTVPFAVFVNNVKETIIIEWDTDVSVSLVFYNDSWLRVNATHPVYLSMLNQTNKFYLSPLSYTSLSSLLHFALHTTLHFALLVSLHFPLHIRPLSPPPPPHLPFTHLSCHVTTKRNCHRLLTTVRRIL